MARSRFPAYPQDLPEGLQIFLEAVRKELSKLGVSGGASIQVQESSVVTSSAANILNFLGTDFDLTQSPVGKVNINANANLARLASIQTWTAKQTFSGGIAGPLAIDTGSVTINPGPLIVGTDPGSSDLVRVGGKIRARKEIRADAAALTDPIFGWAIANVDLWQAYVHPATDNALRLWDGTLDRVVFKIGGETDILTGPLVVGADPGTGEILRTAGNFNFNNLFKGATAGAGVYVTLVGDSGVADRGGLLLNNTTSPTRHWKQTATFTGGAGTSSRFRMGWVTDVDKETWLNAGAAVDIGPTNDIKLNAGGTGNILIGAPTAVGVNFRVQTGGVLDVGWESAGRQDHRWYNASAALDEKRWEISVDGVAGAKSWALVVRSDAAVAGGQIFRAFRTGTVIDSVDVGFTVTRVNIGVNSTSVVVGTDPGGAQLLRVGGSSRFNGAMEIMTGGLNVLGNIRMGAAPDVKAAIWLDGTRTSTSTSQYGLNSEVTFSSAATVEGTALWAKVSTPATVFTMASGYGLNVSDANKGAGSIITTLYGVYVASQTQGATNYALYTNTGDVSLGDRLVLRPTVSKVVPGATSLSLRNTADSADNLILTDAGLATFRNNVAVVSTASAALDTFIDRQAGFTGGLNFRTAGSGRWGIYVTETAEGGADSGSNFRIRARTDAGVFLDDPITVVRAATGAIALGSVGNRPVVVGADPGGTQLLRVGGGARFNGATEVITGGLTVTAGGVAVTAGDVSIASGKLLIDGVDQTLSSGQVGLAENGGGLWIGARDIIRLLMDDDASGAGSVIIAKGTQAAPTTLAVFDINGALILGTDPGGVRMLRVGGSGIVNGSWQLANAASILDWSAGDITIQRGSVTKLTATTTLTNSVQDFSIDVLGTFDHTGTRFGTGTGPVADDVMSWHGSAQKWRPRFLQTQFSNGVVFAQNNTDGTFANFAFSVTYANTTPAVPSVPVVTPIYGGFIIDMGALPPSGHSYVVDYSINAGAFTSNRIIFTSQKMVHTVLSNNGTQAFLATDTFSYKAKGRGKADGTFDSAYSAASTAASYVTTTEVNAFGLVLASQVTAVYLSAITANVGSITAGQLLAGDGKSILQLDSTFSVPSTVLQGIFFASANPVPVTVTGMYIDFTATTTNPLFHHTKFDLLADGSAILKGVVRDTNSKFVIDVGQTTARLLTIIDEQITPRTRVKIGEVNTGTSDWGIQVFDNGGATIVDMTAANLLIQDSAAKFKADFTAALLTVTDAQVSAKVRVKLGNITGGTTGYGLQVFDTSGSTIVDMSAANLLIQDAALKFKADFTGALLTVTDNQGAPKIRAKLGKVNSGTTDYGLQVFDTAGSTIVDMTASNLLIQDAAVKLKADFTGALITITDNQAVAKIRAKLGKVGAGTTDYGLQVFDNTGATIVDMTTSNLLVQDAAIKFKADFTNALLTVTDAQGSPKIRGKFGKIGAGTMDYGLQIFDNAGVTIVDMQSSNLLIQDSAAKYVEDFTNALLTVTDAQTTPVVRVKTGKVVAASAELVTNGGGETGTPGSPAPSWTFGAGNALNVANDFAHSGSNSLKIDNTVANDSYSYQDVTLTAGRVYRLSGWIKTSALPTADAGWGAVIALTTQTGITGFTILSRTGNNPDPGIVTPERPDVGIAADGATHAFTYVETIFIPLGSSGTGRLYCQLGFGGTQSGQVWWDDVSVTALADYGTQIYDAAGATIVDFTGGKRIMAVPVQPSYDSGTAYTVDLQSGLTQQIRLTGTATITLVNPIDGGRYRMWLQQDVTGSRPFPTIKGPNGEVVMYTNDTAPTLTATPGVMDLFELEYRKSPTSRFTCMPLQTNVFVPTPTVDSVTATQVSVASATHNVVMPATVNAGDLLIIIVAWAASPGTVTTPTGWTLGGTTNIVSVFTKIAVGTEGGTTVNVATVNSVKAAGQTYRMHKWYGSDLTNSVTTALASSAPGTSADPSAVTPTGGPDRFQVIAGLAVTANPAITDAANYANFTQTDDGSVAVRLRTGRRQQAAKDGIYMTTEDPAAFTWTGSQTWTAITIAVRPPA